MKNSLNFMILIEICCRFACNVDRLVLCDVYSVNTHKIMPVAEVYCMIFIYDKYEIDQYETHL
jgi:hypothetical protein